MKYHSLVPMLYTNDIDETVKFYETHLGFACDDKDDDWGWASISKDGVRLMVTKPNEHLDFDKPEFTGSFYIKTSHVDALWQSVKDSVEVCYAIDNFEWNMREFAIYDNNGYVIQFGEELSLN
ncbi:VOC family protein [Winogradskyella sp. 3972H.M.0a.05]|uniref:VOC family protein n=1 Tax=Winogradskyella sp. 3972H.M.0a.05 TaxID=2950277 RepID=UPI003393A19C